MRDNYTADWAFSAKGSIENVVEENFSNEAHRWPLLRTFDFECFIWHGTHLILILRNKYSGIPAGPGIPRPLIDPDAPSEIPNPNNIFIWYKYLVKKFDVKPEDLAIVIPIDHKADSFEEERKNLSNDTLQMWRTQISLNIQRHFYHIKGFDMMDDFFIPPGYTSLADNCKRFFADHPNYNENIFIMTRFEKGDKLLEELDKELRSVIRKHGLNPLRADDKMYLRDRNLWNNVCVYMICSKYGIAILEDRIRDEFNPNVALEYGFMRALNKPTLLLQDIGFRNIRADIIGTLRETFDITDIRETIRTPIETWLRELDLIAGAGD